MSTIVAPPARPTSPFQATGNKGELQLVGSVAMCWDGSDWVAAYPWQDWATTWSASGTAPSLGNGSLVFRYQLRDSSCTVHIEMVAGTTTVVGGGNQRFDLPAGIMPAHHARLFAANPAGAGVADIGPGGSVLEVTLPVFSYALGSVITVDGAFEMS